MYYASGNYEAFAHPEKPLGVEGKSAHIVGTGLAALTAACYLIRDGQMSGERIHIYEKDPIPGGACDGYDHPGLGYIMRGGREMDNHFIVGFKHCISPKKWAPDCTGARWLVKKLEIQHGDGSFREIGSFEC